MCVGGGGAPDFCRPAGLRLGSTQVNCCVQAAPFAKDVLFSSFWTAHGRLCGSSLEDCVISYRLSYSVMHSGLSLSLPSRHVTRGGGRDW